MFALNAKRKFMYSKVKSILCLIEILRNSRKQPSPTAEESNQERGFFENPRSFTQEQE